MQDVGAMAVVEVAGHPDGDGVAAADGGGTAVTTVPGDSGGLSWYCRRDCSKSWESALSKGCIFDELEFRFTHPECVGTNN